jgi:glycosyltransferase involved in cell wall biosynthesis
MDRTNLQTTEQCLGLRIAEPHMLAIPAQAASDRPHAPPDLAAAGLRVAWVGRIVDFKFFPLVHALRRLNGLQASLGVAVSVLIVGAGDYETRLRQEVAALTQIDVRFQGEVEPQALQDLLAGQVDLLLAMGTSALEGARLGVPTLLLDLSYREIIPGCRFAWLHEQDGYSLAGIVQPCPEVESMATLASRVQQLLAAPAVVSAAAREYYRTHHEISRIASRLIELTDRTRCAWGQLQDAGLLQRGLVYSVFSGVRDRGVRK